jgi:hypothetical protein
MTANPIREKIMAQLDDLSDEQATAVLEFIESVKDSESIVADDLENDPLVGFISGPTDMAEHTEELLKREFGLQKPGNDRQE